MLILDRLKALLPAQWFQDATPVLDTVLSGVGKGLSDVYDLTVYAKLQTRISTATDLFLDLIAFDFFGGTLPRRTGESDPAFRTRIQTQLLLERGTRKGLRIALETLTGRTPMIFEPRNTADAGGYNRRSFYNGGSRFGAILPFQVFVIAYRPVAQLGGKFSAFNTAPAAFNSKKASYGNLAQSTAAVTDQDILNLIDAVKPVGTIVWVQIQS